MSSTTDRIFVLGGTGDFSDLSSFRKGIKDHNRLFLLIGESADFVNLQTDLAKIAYGSGVEQVNDISSFLVNMGWRTSYVGAYHYSAEKAIFDLPGRGTFVTLRPGKFMSNFLITSQPSADNKIFDSVQGDSPQILISTNDVGAVAAVILTEEISKHADAVYSLIGDVVSPIRLAQIVSKIVSREIKYQQVKPILKHKKIMESGHCSHILALDLSAS